VEKRITNRFNGIFRTVRADKQKQQQNVQLNRAAIVTRKKELSSGGGKINSSRW
jgi:hypothetical protein